MAEQLINGVKSIVILRSRSLDKVLLAITPGTVQPKPISIGTMLLPDNPTFLKSLSITNATLAIYPLSSSRERKKKKSYNYRQKSLSHADSVKYTVNYE